VHSDAAIRKRGEAPILVFPSSDLTFKRGRAIMVVMSNPSGQGMFLRVHSSLMMSQAWEQLFASQLNTMCCIDSIVLQCWQIPHSSKFLIFSQ